jgi:acyl-CoA thioesterase-1
MTGVSAFWGPDLRWLLQPPAPRIVFIGDSLTSGRGFSAIRAYPAVLQHRLDEAGWRYRVVNAGVSGDTSGRALDRLPGVLDGDVRLLVVALGADDALRGEPIAQLKANLARIIEAAQRRRIRVLLCGLEGRRDGSADTARFRAAYHELAARYQVALVPFMLQPVIDDPALMQPDSLHPNAAGAAAIAGVIWPYLEPLVEADAAAAAKLRHKSPEPGRCGSASLRLCSVGPAPRGVGKLRLEPPEPGRCGSASLRLCSVGPAPRGVDV